MASLEASGQLFYLKSPSSRSAQPGTSQAAFASVSQYNYFRQRQAEFADAKAAADPVQRYVADPAARWMNATPERRLTVGLVGSVGEVGTGLLASSTGGGAVLGVPLIAHGIDTGLTAYGAYKTGVPQATATQRALQAMGMNSDAAQATELLTFSAFNVAAGPIAATRAAGAVGPAARFTGRFLADESGSVRIFGSTAGTVDAEAGIGQLARTASEMRPLNTTRSGVPRTNAADWRALRDHWDDLGYGEILSDANRSAIGRGVTPKVDDAWINVFPEDAGLVGERITMHHIGGSPITVPLAATRHLDAHMPGGFRYNPGGPGSALPVYPAPE